MATLTGKSRNSTCFPIGLNDQRLGSSTEPSLCCPGRAGEWDVLRAACSVGTTPRDGPVLFDEQPAHAMKAMMTNGKRIGRMLPYGWSLAFKPIRVAGERNCFLT